VSFVAITLYVASQRVFIVVSVYFVTDSVRKLLDTPSYVILILRLVLTTAVSYTCQCLLVCDAVQCYGRMITFQLNMEAARSIALCLVTPQHYTASQPRKPRLEYSPQ
jgi:hypothetical protein